jgi:hypothetical protein
MDISREWLRELTFFTIIHVVLRSLSIDWYQTCSHCWQWFISVLILIRSSRVAEWFNVNQGTMAYAKAKKYLAIKISVAQIIENILFLLNYVIPGMKLLIYISTTKCRTCWLNNIFISNFYGLTFFGTLYLL